MRTGSSTQSHARHDTAVVVPNKKKMLPNCVIRTATRPDGITRWMAVGETEQEKWGVSVAYRRCSLI
jgi:hypothetical protein